MRVLVVEDDASVAAALCTVLQRAEHTTTRVTGGAGLLTHYASADLVLLDLGLDDMDGLAALQQLRQHSDVPVIVVTARGDERSTVVALRLGADDYLIKPVRVHELLARIAAVARRYASQKEVQELRVGSMVINFTARTAHVDEVLLSLTPTEFSLLVALAQRCGDAVSRAELVRAVWGTNYPTSSRAVDVHLAQLRQKLPYKAITTLRGFGFRFEAPE